MPLFEKLNEVRKQFSKEVTIYPYRDVDDEHWPKKLDDDMKEVPAIDYDWRLVGYVVDRPDLPKIKFVEKKSAKLIAIKGMDQPYRDFDPAFIDHVCGVKGNKGLIKKTVGITTMKDGVEVEKEYDPEWLAELMYEGTFLYSEFMKTYNKLMESVKREEIKENKKDENF